MTLKNAMLGAVLAAALAPVAAHAVTEENFQARTLSDLVALCSATPSEGAMSVAAVNFCHGFAQGAVSVEQERDAASRVPKLFCFPSPPPERSATLAEFVKWANANPGHLQDRPADGLFAFLKERFPCPGK